MAFADRLADAAGAEILPYFRSDLEVQNKARDACYDPVTLADRTAEQAIRALIHETYPDHGILGEEFGFEAGVSGLTWVVDPIDGTKSFMTGQLHWASLIALYDGEKPCIGVVDQPYVGERFNGSRLGARVARRGGEEQVLRTRACERLEAAVLCSTGREIFAGDEELAAFDRVASRARMVRYGGDCYLYCMLAAGLVDLVIESTLKPHDVQALIPLVEAAGGIVSGWSGESAVHGGRVIAAGDRRVYERALELLSGRNRGDRMS
ncbi:MAG TPA: histidinol-phosphatase [Gammaproteobacteria bacterium]|nr:histidinol-phosphatase [Gammaproteobacteria bacterium]